MMTVFVHRAFLRVSCLNGLQKHNQIELYLDGVDIPTSERRHLKKTPKNLILVAFVQWAKNSSKYSRSVSYTVY